VLLLLHLEVLRVMQLGSQRGRRLLQARVLVVQMHHLWLELLDVTLHPPCHVLSARPAPSCLVARGVGVEWS
jgi:hypothetical protein